MSFELKNKKFKNDLTQEHVRSILDYNPETGIFIWKWRSYLRPCLNSRYYNTVAGSVGKNGREFISIDNKKYYSHRLAWLYMTGAWPTKEIDHEDLNSLNNKWENLREATSSENAYNRKNQINNTSGHKGISFDKKNNKWRARIYVSKKCIHLGRFISREDAIIAYEGAMNLHGEFARNP